MEDEDDFLLSGGKEPDDVVRFMEEEDTTGDDDSDDVGVGVVKNFFGGNKDNFFNRRPVVSNASLKESHC